MYHVDLPLFVPVGEQVQNVPDGLQVHVACAGVAAPENGIDETMLGKCWHVMARPICDKHPDVSIYS